ncbi:hypothetical protein D9M70_284220 [compost metagenome]
MVRSVKRCRLCAATASATSGAANASSSLPEAPTCSGLRLPTSVCTRTDCDDSCRATQTDSSPSRTRTITFSPQAAPIAASRGATTLTRSNWSRAALPTSKAL